MQGKSTRTQSLELSDTPQPTGPVTGLSGDNHWIQSPTTSFWHSASFPCHGTSNTDLKSPHKYSFNFLSPKDANTKVEELSDSPSHLIIRLAKVRLLNPTPWLNLLSPKSVDSDPEYTSLNNTRSLERQQLETEYGAGNLLR